MNDQVLKEMKYLLHLFGECGKSVCDDVRNIDCTSPANVSNKLLPSLLFKVKKLKECLVSIHKICKAVRKEDMKCLPCLQK